MEIYIEITYFINAFLILLSFEILCFLLNIQMTKKELFKYVITYNIYLFLLYFDMFFGFIMIYDFILCFIFFKKQVYIYFPIYFFIYISLMSFMELTLPHCVLFQGILLIEGINMTSMMIMSVLLVMIIYFYISFCHHQLSQDQWMDVSFQNVQCLGFIDNGNKVFYKGYPVIFISKALLKDYQPIDKIRISTANQQEEVDIILIDDIDINHQTLHHVYAGIMSCHEYDCILNKQLMGGLL